MRRYNITTLKNRRRDLRQRSTLTEKILWNKLRNNQLGFKFRRQYSIDGYVMDFYCPSLKFGVEIEGGIHLVTSQKIYDEYRYRYLNNFNIRILKITTNQITTSVEETLKMISLSLPRRGTKG